VALRGDDRVGACLLAGSLGRGAGDAWSDVDLVVVFRSDAGSVLVRGDAFAAGFGDALFVFDSPWNAPLDGAQVNALYDVGGVWPLYVDWDLWPVARGVIASDVRVLFDRVGLPVFDGPLDAHRAWERGAPAELTPAFVDRARLAMLPIVAKCLVRGDDERAARMLGNLLRRQVDMSTRRLLFAFRELRASVAVDERVARALDDMSAYVVRERR
jgi:hypothetical protein